MMEMLITIGIISALLFGVFNYIIIKILSDKED